MYKKIIINFALPIHNRYPILYLRYENTYIAIFNIFFSGM